MKTEFDLSGLLDYQRPAVAQLARLQYQHRVTLDASDMGTGKTFMGASLIRHFDEPTLVVCPLAVMPSWLRAGQALGTEFDVINYEMLRTGRTPYASATKVPYRLAGDPPDKKRTYNRFDWAPEVGFVLFDEVHRCNGLSSDQSKLLSRAVSAGKRIHMMSATPAESPLKMKSLGYALGLFSSPANWLNWAMRHGCKKGHFGGYTFAGRKEQRKAIMDRIHAQLFPHRGVRLRVDEIPGFPEVSRQVELIGLDKADARKIDALYQEMAAELQSIDAKGIGENEATRLMRQRQVIEMLKVPAIIEMVEDGIEQGKAVAVFVNFRDTITALSARLQTDCIIWGDQDPAERECNRQNFQANKERVILCTDAGGIGLDLHDIRGEFPVEMLINPGWNATSFKQILGRNRRAGARSKALQKILFADGTPEMRVWEKLRDKVGNLDHLCDAYSDGLLDILTGKQ